MTRGWLVGRFVGWSTFVGTSWVALATIFADGESCTFVWVALRKALQRCSWVALGVTAAVLVWRRLAKSPSSSWLGASAALLDRGHLALDAAEWSSLLEA